MRLSYPAGYAFILREEAVILTAYNDGYGEWETHGTIGGGHTNAAGPPKVYPGQKVSLEQALIIFGNDIRRVENDVARTIKTPLSQAQFDALVSFHYNTGGLTAKRCALRDEINAGNTSGLGFMGWTRAGNDPVVLKGRRERERSLFVNGQYGNVAAIPVYEKWPGKARSMPMPPLPGGLSPPLVEPDPTDTHVGKGGPLPVPAPEGPGPGPAPPPPMTQSTTMWASIMAFITAGGGTVLSYFQNIAPAALAILIVGGLAGYIIYQRYHIKQRTGV